MSSEQTDAPAKRILISIASHELKTPVTTLKGLAQFLLKQSEKQGSPSVMLALRTMDAQADRLTRLVNELLDASKIQTGRVEYEEEHIDLAALVREIVELLQPIHATHTLVLSGTSQAWVRGDKDRLGQVVANLISNAIKYSPQADRVDISLTTSERTVMLTVRDYGEGIAKADQQHIFDRFYRASHSQAKASSGLGLGLYIASEIVKRHGGTISVESEEKQGATFTVSLPLAASA